MPSAGVPTFLAVRVGHVHLATTENGLAHVALVVVEIHLVFAMDGAGDGQGEKENEYEFI